MFCCETNLKRVERISVREALFKKYLANQCNQAEIDQILDYFGTIDQDKSMIYSLILQDLQREAQLATAIDPAISETMRRRILQQIAAREFQVGAAHPEAGSRVKGTVSIRRTYWRAAAIFVGFLLMSVTGYRLFFYNPLISHDTVYGEVARIVLPDSSTVVLNGNSRISYRPQWEEGAREVWISGEAYFSVKHTHDDRKFIVHSSKEMDVEVLGTEFNVYDRPDATRVILNSGKVKLNIHQDKDEPAYVTMDPGELVEFQNNLEYEKRAVNAERYSSWVSGNVVLDNTSFGDIVVLLEETYGLSVSVPDTSLYSERFSGTVPSENAEALLKALAISFNLQIKAKGNQVTFNINN